MSKFKKILDDPPIFYHKAGSVWREDNNKWYWSFFNGIYNGPSSTCQEAMNAVSSGCEKPCNYSHELDNQFVCHKCGKQCSSSSGLTLHIKKCRSK